MMPQRCLIDSWRSCAFENVFMVWTLPISKVLTCGWTAQRQGPGQDCVPYGPGAEHGEISGTLNIVLLIIAIAQHSDDVKEDQTRFSLVSSWIQVDATCNDAKESCTALMSLVLGESWIM